jgi:spore germination protein GerM
MRIKDMDNRMKLAIAAVIVVIVAIVYLTVAKQEKLTETNSVAVYFVKTSTEGEKVLSVRRKINKNADKFNFALTELINGPSKREKKQGYFSEIPAGTKIISINSTVEKKVINLSQEFETGGGSSTMEMRMEQLISTALDSAINTPVYLQIEGKQVNIIGGEGIPVPQPLAKVRNKGSEGQCK